MNALPEKWQWVLSLNPMTAVITASSWGVLDTAPDPARADAVERRRDRRASSSSGSVLPPLRAAVRRHDLMARRDRQPKGSRSVTASAQLQAPTGRCATRSHRGAASLRPRAPAAARRTSGRCATSRSTCSDGEVLGIIGRNGAGKSTLLKILTRITTPTEGRAEIRGRVGSLLEVGTGFHPELTGRENVFLNGSMLGMKRREIQRKFHEIVEFAGVEKFIDTPVKRYSSGMYVRLAFAVAAHLEPEILLVDEVLAVGDAEFQRRCLGRMEDLGESGRTVLFVSHNMQAIAQLCDRTILLDDGRVVRDGPSADVVAYYLQAGHGTGSTRRWDDADDAPGDDLVRLRSVRVSSRTATRSTRPMSAIRSGSRSASRVLRHGDAGLPEDQGLRPAGRRRFNALDTSPRWHDSAPPGEYVSTAWIPANLLNEGLDHGRRRGSCSLGAPKLHPHAGEFHAVVLPRLRPGRGRLGPWTVRRAVAGRRPAAARVDDGGAVMQIVGIVLVRNEDISRRAGDPQRRGFCDRIHAVDHVSTDGTWDILQRSSAIRPPRRTAHACTPATRTRFIEQYAGTDTWVFGVDGDELYDPHRLARACAKNSSAAHTTTSSRSACERAQLRGARPGGRAPPRAISRLPHVRSRSSTTSPRSSRGRATARSGSTAATIVVPAGLRRERASTTSANVFRWDETPLRCLQPASCGGRAADPEHEHRCPARSSWRAACRIAAGAARSNGCLRAVSRRAVAVEAGEVHARRARHRRRLARSSSSGERVALRRVAARVAPSASM